jgi:hypothetical protein
MAVDKFDVRPGDRRTNLFARCPLTFYFVIAFGGTWIVWSLFVLSQDGAGLLPFRSPTSFMLIMFLGQVARAHFGGVCYDSRYGRKARPSSFSPSNHRMARWDTLVSVGLGWDSGNHDVRHDRPSRNFTLV